MTAVLRSINACLDFDTAIVTESYVMDGVSYELTAFASSPDSVIAVRVCASKPVLYFSAGIERGERVSNFSYGTHEDEIVRYAPAGLVMQGNCGGETGLRFRGALFGTGNGDTAIIGDKLVFEKASEVVLYFAAGTNFENRGYRSDLCRTLPCCDGKRIRCLPARSYCRMECFVYKRFDQS